MNVLFSILKTHGWSALLLALVLATAARSDEDDRALTITAPPESFFAKMRDRDREVARAFYEKYLDIHGIPVAASEEVADEALLRTHEIVSHLLAGRKDIIEEMVRRDLYLIIIGKD
ncbi:MAG TPA: hypothetical protein VK116_14355, partial [Planctomycetota bacterium]|nr:hypothetical protein [Planctomycetota bacterium]